MSAIHTSAFKTSALRAVTRRPDGAAGLLLFGLALAVYGRTLCPTIYWGDCGELAAAAYTLGITHPTGYPLWCLLAKAWTLLLPVGTVIWRLNVLSAVCGGAAVILVFGAARFLAVPRPAAFLAAGLFAFSHTFWQQCLFAETYTLTACYTAGMLLLALRWRARGCRDADLPPLALACGLAMTNGQINTLFLPGVVGFVLWSRPRLLQMREPAVRAVWGRALGLALLPLLSYAYLPLRARVHPTADWGDPETPDAFFYHVTGRPYAPLMFHLPPGEVFHNLQRWAHGLGGEFPLPLLLFSLGGLATLWRERATRPAAFLLGWVVAADVFYTVNYAIYNQYIYFIPAYIALALAAGVGLTAVGTRLAGMMSPAKRPALGVAALTLLLAAQIAGHWRADDLHDNWSCYDYGRNLLASVPPGGLLIDNGGDDSQAPLKYLQRVEGARPDVVYISRGMLWSLYDFWTRRWANRWYWRELGRSYPPVRRLYAGDRITKTQCWQEDPLRRLLRQAVGAGRAVAVIRPAHLPPIIDDQGHPSPLSEYLARTYDVAPVGLLLRVYARGGRPSGAALLAQTRSVWRGYSLHGVYDGLYADDPFLTPMAIDYADAGLARARLAEAQGQDADAATAYGGVLRLFHCDEASAGLARCARRASKTRHVCR